MVEGETCNTGIKEDSKLFFQCDELRRPVPSILEGKDKSCKYMFLDPKLFAYALGMTIKEFKNPRSTAESRIIIGNFIIVSLRVIDRCKGNGHHSSGGSLDNDVFLVEIVFYVTLNIIHIHGKTNEVVEEDNRAR